MDVMNINYKIILLVVICGSHSLVRADCIDTVDMTPIQNSSNSIYIDTRDSLSFEKYKLPGSINVQPRLIGTKTIWHNKKLYLIGYGYDDYSMIELCRKLYSRGFNNVSVKRHGVLPNNIEKGSLDPSLYFIGTKELVSVLNAYQAVLVDITTDRLTNELGINGVHYVAAENVAEFRKAAEKSRTLSHLPLIIVASDTSKYTDLYRLNNGDHNPVFFVEGGIKALKKYIRYIDDIRRKTKFELQVVKECNK